MRRRGWRSLAAAQVLFVVVVVLAAAAGAPASPTTRFTRANSPEWSPKDDKLVIVGYEDGGPKARGALYVIDSDGSDARRITPFLATVGAPDWAPDGKRIVFVADYKLWVVGADGSNMRSLGRPGGSPKWGPGGRWIAYHQRGAIFAVSPNGQRDAVVADPARLGGEQIFLMPSWSPDGERLVFCMLPAPDMSASASLGVLRRFGGRVTVVGSPYPNQPDWSPDGRSIALAAIDLRGAATVAVLDLPTRRVRMLRPGGSPSWSSDGRRIAFSGERQIYIMDARGLHLRQVTHAR
ncbi:MAG: PD40 domain-containing protein [Gemmatimonadetes bacterium]|nr:PD40 domain-containing protein [Gemmatimonadota bacterium]